MFWLSYECFSILCNVFLLKSAISSHNSCSDCTTSLMTHLTILYWKGFGQERILTIYTPPPLLKGASTQTSFLPVVAFPFLVHLAWVFKHTPIIIVTYSFIQTQTTHLTYYSTKSHFYFFINFFRLLLFQTSKFCENYKALTKFSDMSKVKLSEIRYYLTKTHL